MFIAQATIKKKANETVRLSIPTRLMDTVRALAKQVNGEPSDVLCQAVEYALSNQGGAKGSRKKPATTDPSKPDTGSLHGQPDVPTLAGSEVGGKPEKLPKE